MDRVLGEAVFVENFEQIYFRVVEVTEFLKRDMKFIAVRRDCPLAEILDFEEEYAIYTIEVAHSAIHRVEERRVDALEYRDDIMSDFVSCIFVLQIRRVSYERETLLVAIVFYFKSRQIEERSDYVALDFLHAGKATNASTSCYVEHKSLGCVIGVMSDCDGGEFI